MCATMSGWWTASTASQSRALKASSPFVMSSSRCAVRLVSSVVVAMRLLSRLVIAASDRRGGYYKFVVESNTQDIGSAGLRERKKARTRRVIADAAARLFAERGYEQVAVSDVAREAEVSEQTVYNYFQTKEQLFTDRDQLVQDELSRLIRMRPPATTPAAAAREFVLDAVEGIRRYPAEQWRGELGYLAAISA